MGLDTAGNRGVGVAGLVGGPKGCDFPGVHGGAEWDVVSALEQRRAAALRPRTIVLRPHKGVGRAVDFVAIPAVEDVDDIDIGGLHWSGADHPRDRTR